jgi:peptidase M1-like protein
MIVLGALLAPCAAQSSARSTAATPAQTGGTNAAEALYLQLGQVTIDPSRVYRVREAAIDRPSFQITLEDGTIAFTEDVMGHVTGAFFEGDGEILLTPPDEVERRSLSLFTRMAILEERFATAYFRFNDDTVSELAPNLRAVKIVQPKTAPAQGTQKKDEEDQDEEESEEIDPQAFLSHWAVTAKNLAQGDAMRLLVTFSRMLPASGDSPRTTGAIPRGHSEDRFLHVRLQGAKLGIFDAYYDSTAAEQAQIGQLKTTANGTTYYDVWAEFATGAHVLEARGSGAADTLPEDWACVRRFVITTEVRPPKQIRSEAKLAVEVKEGGERTLLFELSRFLQIEKVTLDGKPVEFIHNPAVEGTQLSRRGNDLVAVILPEVARQGQKMELDFVYSGEVLAEAGSGLLYVGARGTWYPNRGLAMADYELQFTYPQDWTLVATGRLLSLEPGNAGVEVSRWASERPLPVAGFNLGKYRAVKTQAGDVTVETYATPGLEREFPLPVVQTEEPAPSDIVRRPQKPIATTRPSPAQNAGTVGEAAARAIRYYSERFGPYPYGSLALTQMPGRDSQGWPGLIFLSSYAFLSDTDREQMHFSPAKILIQQSIPAHETAHQWWGDLVGWKSYRDQWMSEGLANYCALMMLQEKNPEGFHQIMESYRQELLIKDKSEVAPIDAGPVTLGSRLLSSRFPEGYEAIMYGRGTWLFHMLRTMLKDTATARGQGRGQPAADEPFVRALRRVREKYQGRTISTSELLAVFEEQLPPSSRYEGKKSLDWFLEGWINGTSMPKLELKNVTMTPKGEGLEVTASIVQHEAPKDLVTSVPVYAVLTGRRPVLLGRVFADGGESSFRITAPAGTHKVVLDPEGTILTSPK